MKDLGIIEVDLLLGKRKLKWPVYVANIRDEVLLGCDVIDELNITVNTKQGLQLDNKWLQCEVTRIMDKTAEVKIAKSVTIPGNSEFVLIGRCNALTSDGNETYILEADDTIQRKIMVARSIYNPTSNRVPVRVMNTRYHPVRLKKGSTVGQLLQVETITETGIAIGTNTTEEVSICRLKTAEGRHNHDLRQPTQIEDINPDEMKNLRSVFESSSDNTPKRTLSEIPEHLKTLYESSQSTLTREQDQKFREILTKYQDAFARTKNDLGKCSVLKHHIDTADAAPVRQPLRRTPQAFEGEEEKYIKDQLESGTIYPSKSDWASPLVMVRKRDGEVRVCIDYRKLNERTVKDAYPLPRIDMCIDCLSSAKVFSTIDLQSAYMQLELAEEDRHKSAFITKYGLFEYAVLPFGVCNGPSTFQRCIELIFRGLQWEILLVYLDDIIVISEDVDQHLERLETVFKRLYEANLKMKPGKCEFFKSEVLFLGHIVGQNGIQPNPQTLTSVKEWKAPTDVKQIQQYLGLCSYYRQYIPNFSHIAAPLTKLTRKGAEFIWDGECQQAFDHLKDRLCSSPLLAYPKPGLKYILDCDASDLGIGAVLSQIQDGCERPIAYASKRLNQHQEKYSVTRRELLAVVVFMNHFRHYLLGKKFLLRTDHGSLRWIFEFKNPRGQVARWLEHLSQFDFDIEHRAGTKHQNADGLSRRDFEKCAHDDDEDQQCQQCEQTRKDWENFTEEVDNVVDVGIPIEGKPPLETIVRSIKGTERVIKEHQDVKDLEDQKIDPTTSFLPCYTNTDLEAMQREDEELQILHQWIDERQLPDRETAASYSPALRKYWLNAESLIRKNGVIYRKVWFTIEKKGCSLQLLVPKCLKNEVIRNHHDTLMAGHFGRNKTSLKIKEKFYWYKLEDDVKLHIYQCEKCNRSKHPNPRMRAPQRKYHVGYPMDRIGIDIMGPLPITDAKNKYILVVGDYFTRYMEAYCIPNQQAETVAHKLVMEFISRYGIPLELHSDQGRNLESDLFKEILHLLQITKTRTTAYRPSSNGLIERFNGTLASMIRKFVDKNLNNWDKYINLLLAAYRSTTHPATGYTPNMLMFGREVNLPSDLLYPFPKPEAPPNVHDYVMSMREQMEDCYYLAREALRETAERQKRDHDTRIVEKQYQKGDLVMKLTSIGSKFDSKYSGPYVITERLSPAIYKIRNRKKTSVVHHDRLKLFVGEKPKWVKSLRDSTHSDLQ